MRKRRKIGDRLFLANRKQTTKLKRGDYLYFDEGDKTLFICRGATTRVYHGGSSVGKDDKWHLGPEFTWSWAVQIAELIAVTTGFALLTTPPASPNEKLLVFEVV